MSSRKTMWDELRDPEFAHAYFDEHQNTFIATQIKVIREQRNMSQKELAENTGMAQERMSVLENVNYSSWTISTLRRLAKAFGLRLKVSFETFSSGIPEIKNFKRENLLRKSLEEEIEEKFNPRFDPAFAQSIRKELFESQKNKNALDEVVPSFQWINVKRLQSIIEDKTDETNLSRAGAGGLAVSANRFKSARDGNREGWAH